MSAYGQGIPLVDALRALRGKGWSGAVRVHQPLGAGAVFLREGEVVHAEYGSLSGEFAYWQLLGLPDAALQLDPHAAANRRSILRVLPPPVPQSWERALGPVPLERLPIAGPRPAALPASLGPRAELAEQPGGPRSLRRLAPTSVDPEPDPALDGAADERMFAPLLASEYRVEFDSERRGPAPNARTWRGRTGRADAHARGVRPSRPLLAGVLGVLAGVVMGGYWASSADPATPPAAPAGVPVPAPALAPPELPPVSAAMPAPSTAPAPSAAAGAPAVAEPTALPEAPARPSAPAAAALDIASTAGAASSDPALALAAARLAVQQAQRETEQARAREAEAQAAALAAAVEASTLVADADAPPRLLQAPEPVSPDPQLSIAPEIPLRLLIDERGAVARAALRRARPELERFESAALETARLYRFQPARRQGQPVAVWIDASVRFR